MCYFIKNEEMSSDMTKTIYIQKYDKVQIKETKFVCDKDHELCLIETKEE